METARKIQIHVQDAGAERLKREGRFDAARPKNESFEA